MSASITIPLDQAVAAFGSVLPHASKDVVTPVITYLSVIDCDTDENASYVVGTDRYSVGRYRIDARVTGLEPDGSPRVPSFMVIRAVAEYISKVTPATLRFGKTAAFAEYKIRVTVYDETSSTLVEVLYGEAVEKSQAFDIAGKFNFPPVARLFPDLSDDKMNGVDAFALSSLSLTKAIASHKFAANDKNEALTFRVFHTESNKPAPVYVAVGDRFAALLQPNLLTR